jgi:hypothetical protein
MEDNDSLWFRLPVSLKDVRGYTKRVFCPIDLSTMLLRLRHLYYRSLHVRVRPICCRIVSAICCRSE